MSRTATQVRPHPPVTCNGGDMVSPNDTRLPARFRAKFVVNPETNCWEWTSTVHRGYGRFHVNRKSRIAHRYVYEILVGPIPDGLTIDHLCRVRCCVLPDHLEVVTGRINTLRGFGPPALNARKTHCLRGHPYDEANTYVFPGTGWRRCRTCFREEWAS